MALTIEAIRIYPVKGLRGLSLTTALVEPWGLAGDRRWMVVDAEGRFVTQRQVPRMALLQALPTPEGLTLSGPGLDPIDVPLPRDSAPPVMTTVWANTVLARSAGPEVAVWLGEALGRPARLVHMANPEQARPIDPDYAALEDRVSFADGFPLLVTTAASLEDLNRRLDRPVTMDRFRTNLLVGGGSPWMEDGWRRLGIGDAIFMVAKDCARCAVTTVDQDSGEKSPDTEPLRSLALFRRDPKGRIIFGQNLIPLALGRIAVGDRIEVLAAAQSPAG